MISAQILSRIIALGSRFTSSVIKDRSSGFATGRSTVDRIIALSILAQTRRQFHQPLLIMLIAAIAYVDLKVAFDAVDRKIAGQLLKEISLPDKIVSIIAEWLDLTWTEGATVPCRNCLSKYNFVLICSNNKLINPK